MFTGLIQETGKIVSLRKMGVRSVGAALTRVTVSAERIPPELKTGDSVAVSGVCLTAVEIDGSQFAADLAAETLQRTSLGGLQPGSLVTTAVASTDAAQDKVKPE